MTVLALLCPQSPFTHDLHPSRGSYHVLVLEESFSVLPSGSGCCHLPQDRARIVGFSLIHSSSSLFSLPMLLELFAGAFEMSNSRCFLLGLLDSS